MMWVKSNEWRKGLKLLIAPSLFLILLRATPCACANYWTIECAGRKLNVFEDKLLTWDEARQTCKKYNSVLAQMINQEDRKCFITEIAHKQNQNYWLGGKRENPGLDCKPDRPNGPNPCRYDAWDGFCKEFYWLQPRERIKQEFWANPSNADEDFGDEPNNRYCTEDCVEINLLQDGANDLNCSAKNYYICNAAKNQPTRPPLPSGGTDGPGPPIIPGGGDCTSSSLVHTPHNVYPILFNSFSLLTLRLC